MESSADSGRAQGDPANDSIEALVAPLGGLGGVTLTDLERLIVELPRLPDAASAVARLADGVRTIAGILRDSPYDALLTARILARLGSIGVLVPTRSRAGWVAAPAAPRAPTPVSSAKPGPLDDPIIGVDLPRPEIDHAATGWDAMGLPSAEEYEGEGVDEDIRRWLMNERVPDVLLSDDHFAAAFATHKEEDATGLASTFLPPVPLDPGPEARVEERFPQIVPAAAQPPGRLSQAAPASPPPAIAPSARVAWDRRSELVDPEPLDDEPAPPGSPSRAVWMGAIVIVAAVVTFVSWVAQPRVSNDAARPVASAERKRALPAMDEVAPLEVPAIEPVRSATEAALEVRGAVPAETPSSTAETAVAGEVPRHIPIANADAPEDVRRAEALLNEGAYPEAAKLLAQLRASRPNDPAVWILSGQLYVDSGGRLSLAGEAAARALALDPRAYRAWVLKGSVHQFLGQKKDARDAYAKALALEPDHPMSAELKTIVAGLH